MPGILLVVACAICVAAAFAAMAGAARVDEALADVDEPIPFEPADDWMGVADAVQADEPTPIFDRLSLEGVDLALWDLELEAGEQR